MIELLKKTLMFSSFTEKELLGLNEMTSVIKHKAGHTLFQQGQDFKCFYYITKGILKLSRLSEEGEEKVIEVVRESNFFAEALMFLESSKYPVQATVMCPSEFIAIDATKYRNILRKSPNGCFQLLGNMSHRIHSLVREIDLLTLHSTKSRLAGYIVQCTETHQQLSFNLELPKSTIASRLSMKPETFSRALHYFHEIGLIDIDKKNIKVINKKGLEKFIHEESSNH